MTTKQQLTIGTKVRLTVDPLTIRAISRAFLAYGADLSRPTYAVKDLLDRKTYDRPDRVGIGPADLGIAFSVTLDQIELA